MTYTAIDCQSFAGGFSLGVVQAGFTLIGKREFPGAFGAPAMEGNRHLLGHDWKAEDSAPEAWTPLQADLVFGNPPCSGFSNRSSSIRGKAEDGSITKIAFRGIESKANDCMHALVEYAAKCDPKIVMFESVQNAYRKGLPLMRELRTKLETLTNDQWTLYHVLHNVKHLGGAQDRPRYFWVASRVPFGVRPTFLPPTSVRERIGDLETVELGTMNGHDAHQSLQETRISELAAKVEWLPNETSGHVYAKAVEQNIDLENWSEPLVSDKGTTQFAPRRLNYDTTSRVLAGDAKQKVLHPVLNRTITHREIARLTGFPDTWNCTPYQEKQGNSCWWGKGITVEAGRWIADAAFAALTGEPEPYWGEPIGVREYLIDATDQEAVNNESYLFDYEEA